MRGDSLVPEALDRLTLADVWDLAPIARPVPPRNGVVLSPFREERDPSFSVSGDGRKWKDFGTGERRAGVWDFVARATGWERGRIAKEVIERAGLVDREPVRKKLAKVPEDVARLAKIGMRAEVRRSREKRRRESERRLYQRIEEARELPPEGEAVPAWPDFVQERWNEGTDDLLGSERVMKRIADARGWPMEWVWRLAYRGAMGFPLLPQGRARGKAFCVEIPEYAEDGNVVRLRPVGYHQRFFFPGYDGRPGRKGWTFVPYLPKEGRKRYWTDFERLLFGLGRRVPAVPFVIGEFSQPQFVVITEGQWDAVTIWGALGGFDAEDPVRVAVFGMRGASGVNAFLSYWGRWLAARKLPVWVMRDNDEAGEKWTGSARIAPGVPPEPNFVDRLGWVTGRKVVVSAPQRLEGVKDFNDYWKIAGAIAPDVMWRWIKRKGLLDG